MEGFAASSGSGRLRHQRMSIDTGGDAMVLQPMAYESFNRIRGKNRPVRCM
jgi:hypothetical protein